MIPIRDENPRRVFPIVTLVLVIANVLVFIYQLTLGPQGAQQFIFEFGAVPALVLDGQNLHGIFTSMFLHGGLMHLLGNMLYLWIFGDNIEGLNGHFRFVMFYLICGIVAFLSQLLLDPASEVPMVGASGAISGVLGAYAVRFPRATVHVLIPLFPIIWLWRVIRVPAAVALGFWFLMQIASAIFSGTTGVAWWAHIGGFVAGVILIQFFEKAKYKVYYR